MSKRKRKHTTIHRTHIQSNKHWNPNTYKHNSLKANTNKQIHTYTYTHPNTIDTKHTRNENIGSHGCIGTHIETHKQN